MATAPSLVDIRVQRFIDRVQSGKYPAGRLVKLAVRRHLHDLEHAGERGLEFDHELAQQALDFYPLVRLTTGRQFAGQPFELRDFQAFVVASLFGWIHSDTGHRRFRHGLYSLGRGNGKSPFGAATGLLLTFADTPREPRAEGYCFATKKDQAKIVFEEACRFVAGSAMSEVLTVTKAAVAGPDGSTFQKMGSDSANSDGLVTHCAIVDELHAWREFHRGLDEKIMTSLGKREQSMRLVVTTAGDENSHLWIELYDYCKAVLEQSEAPPKEPFGDDYFAFIAEVDREDDIYDESNWAKSNPMLLQPELGCPVRIDHLRSLAKRAAAGDRVIENQFRRYHCNQRVSSTAKPITAEAWARCDSPMPSDEELAQRTGFGGVDLARSRDFSAVALVWPLGEAVAVKSWGFTCEDRSEQLRTLEFQQLLDQGNVIVCPGDEINYAMVREVIVSLSEQFSVQSWAYDAAFATETAQWLEQEHGLLVVKQAQSAAVYNEPTRKVISDVTSGTLIHGNDPLLRWAALNLVVRTGADQLMMPAKDKSTSKIDPIVAMIMARRESLFSAVATPTYYDDHDLEIG